MKSTVNRLRDDLVTAGQYGRYPQRLVSGYNQLDPDHGVTRPTGSEANRCIRDFCVKRMKDAGLKVRIDRIGNIFGRKKGVNRGAGTVMCGSHLDSVVNGGQFDGALGVFCSIEAVRRLADEGFMNDKPIEVVVFTGEEGSAFDLTLLGSAALIGKVSTDDALHRKNIQGQTLEESIKEIGYLGDYVRELDDVQYYVETHIEQGPVLYNENISIGIVENIVGIMWIKATITGESNHAGTTPMGMRKDALVAAADIVTAINHTANDIVNSNKAALVATVGKLTVHPNGTNIVPGKVELSIDIRDVVEENMIMMRNSTCNLLKELEKKYGVKVDINISPIHHPVQLSEEVQKVIEESTSKLSFSHKRMNSGAGHDAQNMATRVKTGMIFVPSIKGISHAPLEWTPWEDIEKGAAVLTETLKVLTSQAR